MSAQREIARLQGLYDEIAQQSGQISITITRRPDGPENIPPEERAAWLAASNEDGGDGGDGEGRDEP